MIRRHALAVTTQPAQTKTAPLWVWKILGVDPSQPLPAITRKWLDTLRTEQLAKLKSAGASIVEIVRLNLAYEEAKRFVVD
jgi:hypothetical protein